MNPLIRRLHPYPFEQLAALLADVEPPAGLDRIPLSIGEPRHETPDFVLEALEAALAEGAGVYPVSLGLDELREACAAWLQRRFGVAVDPATGILPVNGTREGLFSFAQAVVDPAAGSYVAMPNPFYQIYEGAALLAGAEPWYLPTLAETGFRPRLADVPERVWSRTALVYVCSPGNPTGAVLDAAFYRELLELADRHDFVIAADECYADIYLETPPVSLLEVCRDLGRDDYARCVAFHSLSKRSNIPGLRSGFVAGDARILADYRRYRTYHGCAMPVPTQRASAAAWGDDTHVETNRRLYERKFREVTPLLADVLDVEAPAASFYLWAGIDGDDERYARDLYAATNVVTLPGSYLGREAGGVNPGAGRLRLSLVAPPENCVEAARRIRQFALARGSARTNRDTNDT
ncbi:MAG TPA: succinyldiaminopimelate transaminase [Woeseiaceae bacterium]|nr:succinyldiaminopimelate transaminase [Woeseiaceae bacterium]